MTFSKFFAAAAFTVLALALGAPATLAQTTGASAADTTGTDAGSGITHERLVAALSDIGGRVQAYNAAEGKDSEDVQVVSVTTVLSADEADYADARTRYVNFVSYLQNVTGKVSLLKDALAEADVESADVVAMDVLDDGRIILFYDTREEAAQDTTGNANAPASGGAAADSSDSASGQ